MENSEFVSTVFSTNNIDYDLLVAPRLWMIFGSAVPLTVSVFTAGSWFWYESRRRIRRHDRDLEREKLL